MLQATQRGQAVLPMHDNIMNRSRACRIGREWRERNGRGCATREREWRQTDLITIVNGINGISYGGQTRRTVAWFDTIQELAENWDLRDQDAPCHALVSFKAAK